MPKISVYEDGRRTPYGANVGVWGWDGGGKFDGVRLDFVTACDTDEGWVEETIKADDGFWRTVRRAGNFQLRWLASESQRAVLRPQMPQDLIAYLDASDSAVV